MIFYPSEAFIHGLMVLAVAFYFLSVITALFVTVNDANMTFNDAKESIVVARCFLLAAVIFTLAFIVTGLYSSFVYLE